MAIGTTDYDSAAAFDPEEVEPMIVHGSDLECTGCGTMANVREMFVAAIGHNIGKDMPQFEEQTVSVRCGCEGPCPSLHVWFWRHPEGE